MWHGKVTEELRELAKRYAEENDGMHVDSYDDVYYHAISYDEFVAYIKMALERHCSLIEAMDIIDLGGPREGVDYEKNY